MSNPNYTQREALFYKYGTRDGIKVGLALGLVIGLVLMRLLVVVIP